MGKHQHELKLVAVVPEWFYPIWKMWFFCHEWWFYGIETAIDNWNPERI